MSGLTRVDQIGLAGLALFSMASVAGYATFVRRPELLATFPSSAGSFPVAFEFFARGHILVAFAALAISLSARAEWGWLPGLAVAGGLSLGAELLGTAPTRGTPTGGSWAMCAGAAGPTTGSRACISR